MALFFLFKWADWSAELWIHSILPGLIGFWPGITGFYLVFYCFFFWSRRSYLFRGRVLVCLISFRWFGGRRRARRWTRRNNKETNEILSFVLFLMRSFFVAIAPITTLPGAMGSATGAEDETKNRNAGVDTGVALWRRSSFLVVLTMMTMTVMILCCDDWSVVWARFTTSRVALSTLSAIQLSRNERVAGLLWRRYRVFFFTEFSLIVRPSRYGGRRRGPSRRRGRCQIKKKTKKGIENEKLKNKNKKKTERAERENDEPSATTKVNAFLFSDLSKRKIEKKNKIK